ncbi:IclR family transcriptional regulator [Halogeometricum pallidum JCM 14848]|uniref:IclR family transcriptional regulator n=1 Tax=Halogeometricum pallidum JCM 14848 TaxID=1227487 RepID=M0CYU5_HALPD|nr:IclR family transcriptional regulator [Halogeometricum pallidum]ELZ28406.1 IclR family transcriptional regulator [Halogeometricum pallidum JCM 14848]
MSIKDRVSTTEKSLEVVFALQRLRGATLAELAAELDAPKSTVHRHLSTLAEHSFVRTDDGRYEVGFRFLELAEYARTQRESYELAEATVEQLAEETQERAQFVVEEHGRGVYLYVETSEHAVQTGHSVGKRIRLHSTAAGKVILTHLPDDRVDDILDAQGLTPETDRTITDRTVLDEELAEISEQGYAFNREENIKGLCAAAAPVTNDDDELIGVLSVSGPSNRMKGEWFTSKIPDLILGSANELELRIAYA